MRDGYYLRYASLNFKPARRVAGIIKPQQSAKFRNRVFRAQIAEFADASNIPQSRAHLNVASGGSIEPSFYCCVSTDDFLLFRSYSSLLAPRKPRKVLRAGQL